MKLNKLYADGHELVVQKRIGKGGEGEVFSIDNLPGFAVKAYLPNLVKERESKIRAMVDAKLSHARSEEHTSELQSLMRISYAVFCLKTTTLEKTKHTKH